VISKVPLALGRFCLEGEYVLLPEGGFEFLAASLEGFLRPCRGEGGIEGVELLRIFFYLLREACGFFHSPGTVFGIEELLLRFGFELPGVAEDVREELAQLHLRQWLLYTNQTFINELAGIIGDKGIILNGRVGTGWRGGVDCIGGEGILVFLGLGVM
jgi:hypothetical protein